MLRSVRRTSSRKRSISAASSALVGAPPLLCQRGRPCASSPWKVSEMLEALTSWPYRLRSAWYSAYVGVEKMKPMSIGLPRSCTVVPWPPTESVISKSVTSRSGACRRSAHSAAIPDGPPPMMATRGAALALPSMIGKEAGAA